jgi:predicted deacylase
MGVTTEEMITLNVAGASNVMRHLGMLPGLPLARKRTVWVDPSAVLTSPHAGTWQHRVRPGQQVRQGDVIGELADYFGNSVVYITSPLDGIVFYVVVSAAIGLGEPLAMVGAPGSAP